MERVRKTYFDPLARTKAEICTILEALPAGSAHPYSPENLLLCRTENEVDEIDVSSYPEDFFFNAVDLDETGQVLLRRMERFKNHLSVFDDFQIQQAPATTFKVPLVSNQITILAVSERTPTYYDFCFADASCKTCCWNARNTFRGISHSGDICVGNDLLDYVKINPDALTDKEICVFISGFNKTQITRFLGTYPALLVADHVDKILYIIPVPLDAATIADATICCPLVIKRDGDSMICSILPTATTDRNMFCSTDRLESPCFPEAIRRADFSIEYPFKAPETEYIEPANSTERMPDLEEEAISKILAKDSAILTSNGAKVPSGLATEDVQIVNFGTGIEFQMPGQLLKKQSTTVTLPCVFGTHFSGPLILATGTVPVNVPFNSAGALRDYYKQLKSALVFVDDTMTDNARNLASTLRMNAVFVVQLNPEKMPKNTEQVHSLLDSVNINAVTALAGHQSLVLVQICDKYYFYRGIANRTYFNTSGLAFGAEVTKFANTAGLMNLADPRVQRVIDLEDANTVLLTTSGQFVRPRDLLTALKDFSIEKIQELHEDLSGVIPQLQAMLSQKDLQELSQALVSDISTKVGDAVAPLRTAYIQFLTQEYKSADSSPEIMKKKNHMLGELRKKTKEVQGTLQPIIASLATMMSTQTTSKRTHDLKRLMRQTQIQGNIEAVKSMTFEKLAEYLETYASDMGVLLLNIDTFSYEKLLKNLSNTPIDASSACELDSRILHLEGFDAGIIMEQSQNDHDGPLQSQAGASHPILAMPYLNQGAGYGSMLAWVCWDEFVNLGNPYSVRWMEKCNESHIAALRIIMRDTLSRATASRQYNFEPGNIEIGNLMSALLMSAMSKLAAMRSTVPEVSWEAQDTVTKLMRGLFGNLLTIAGSGVRPLSMVWQLFGMEPTFDIPKTNVDWIWYETVVALIPYTGWNLKTFHKNLESFLDKTIVRLIVTNESTKEIKSSRIDLMIKFCKLRNIELDHSRTIVTIIMRMLTMEDAHISAIASRLVKQLPASLERQTQSYKKLIKYLHHLAGGGERRMRDDLAAAGVYIRRSAAHRELKIGVANACKAKEWTTVKELCQAMLDKTTEIATVWHVDPAALRVQNVNVYNELRLMNLETDDGFDKKKIHEMTGRVLSDAEKCRVSWQVGKEGEFDDLIEPLDEAFVHEMLTGEKTESKSKAESKLIENSADVELVKVDAFDQFEGSVQSSFLTQMQKDLSTQDVCDILKIPASTMRVFLGALSPEYDWRNLGANFKSLVLDLLTHRSNRLESRPTRKLFQMRSEESSVTLKLEQ